jgi:hypothetical protein
MKKQTELVQCSYIIIVYMQQKEMSVFKENYEIEKAMKEGNGWKLKTKFFWCFFLFLVTGLISLRVADSMSDKYQLDRNHFLELLEVSKPSDGDMSEIKGIVSAMNEKYHTSESIYFFKENEWVTQKRNLITELFYVTERFSVGHYTIVHHYHPDWFFLLPIALLVLSSISLMMWVFVQRKEIIRLSFFLVHKKSVDHL